MYLGKVLGATAAIFLCACSGASWSAVAPTSNDASASGAQDVEVAVAGESSLESNLRRSYWKCVASTNGATWDMQRCIEHEFRYQDSRLNHLYLELLKKLPQLQQQSLRSDERQWVSERDQSCEWSPEADGQAQRIDSNVCSLKRTAERAGELEEMLKDIR